MSSLLSVSIICFTNFVQQESTTTKELLKSKIGTSGLRALHGKTAESFDCDGVLSPRLSETTLFNIFIRVSVDNLLLKEDLLKNTAICFLCGRFMTGKICQK